MNQNDINSIADKIIDAATELKQEKQFDQDKLASLKERENKWQAISLNQLSYFNNLLILLGTGFLAFSVKEFNPSNFSFTLTSLEFRPTIMMFSIISMAGAIFVGLLCGFNRLVDFRYTQRLNKHRRKLYQENHLNYGEGIYRKKIKMSIYYWIKDADYFNVIENEYEDNPDEVKIKINGCSQLISQLGKLTRNFLRFQIVLFLIAIFLFIFGYQ